MRIENFSKQYKGYLVQTQDIESKKRILLIKGGNGSGKSTMLRGIMKLIRYNGTIHAKGTISYMNEAIRFPKESTVMEIINAFNCIDRVSKKRVDSLIDQFDMKDKINDMFSSLSNGMKMKLQLICTFLIDRDMYLLDEPFSGLDQTSVSKLVEYINSSDKRFVIASHLDVPFLKDCDVIQV